MESIYTFDYIVIGAGSGGCVVANRLSAEKRHNVALIEAGGKDSSPWIHIPVGYFKTMGHSHLDWGYYTEPDDGIAHRSIAWPRGRVLGGSGSLNGLLYVRGQSQDYRDWRALGNVGWDWEDVLPLFKRSEAWQGEPSQWRGAHGSLITEPAAFRMPIVDAWIEAAIAAGYPHSDDYNGDTQEGVNYFQMTMHKGLRCSPAKAFLKEAKQRKNLKIFTDALAHKIVFAADKRARAVMVKYKGQIITLNANAEIILCAGAINSPQLLMLSGIGEASELNRHNIAVVHDSPQVGKNMQDHLQARPIYKCSLPTINTMTDGLFNKAKIAAQYALTRNGPLALAASLGTGFLSTRLSPHRPDIQFHLQPFSRNADEKILHKFPAFTASVLQLRPESRGYIALASANPEQHPRIYPNYLSHPTDQETIVEGIRISHRIAQTQPLKQYISHPYEPGDFNENYDFLLAWARQNSSTIYHPTGTCIMGDQKNHVVNPKLQVNGVKALRIADASIMPVIVSGNTNAPTIMIGEKAADIILQKI